MSVPNPMTDVTSSSPAAPIRSASPVLPLKPPPFAAVAPALLDMVHMLTGLDSAYIAAVDEGEDRQTVLYGDDRGELSMPPGKTWSWEDSLCRRAANTGTWSTDDVSRDFPTAQTAIEANISSYISVPILGDDGRILATLCGISDTRHTVPDGARPAMLVLAQLIGEQWNRERLHSAELVELGTKEQQARAHAVVLAEAEHQLKTPLTIITGWAETLLEEETVSAAPVVLNGLNRILQASRRAAQQLEDLLADARTRSLANDLQLRPVNLSALTESIADELPAICTPRHQLRRHVSPDLWAWADPDATSQILWHLAENAVKYSPDGGIISLTLDRVDNPTDGVPSLRMILADQGIGVPEGTVDGPDLFSPFTRGSNTGHISGTGLGLHIVQRLTQAMHGTITAAPKFPRGSQFVLTLPVNKPPA